MKNLVVVFALIVAGALGGCSGDFGAAPALPATRVSGVAAAGSPLQGKVYLKDAGFLNLSTVTTDDGSFVFEGGNLKKPFLLKAAGAADGRNYLLYSISEAGGTANINPLSSAVTSHAAGGDPGAIYDAPDRAALQAVADGAGKSLAVIRASLAPLLKAYDVMAVNPITDPYVANHTGLDRLFDTVDIHTGDGTVSITNNLTGTSIMTAPVTAMAAAGLAPANIPQLPKAAKGKWHLKKSVEVTAGDTPSTKTSAFFYDTAGDLASVVETTTTPGASSPATATTRYSAFDAHGNPAVIELPGQSGTAGYDYDASGRIIKNVASFSVNFPNGLLYYTLVSTSLYTYDSDGSYQVRKTSARTFGTGLQVLLTELYDYDSRGNMLSYSSNGQDVLSYSYAYDQNGNAVTATFTNSENGAKGTASYEWLFF